jgi:hypothetical protein
MAFRSLYLAAAVLPSIVACGGDDGVIIPEGDHYHYVANTVLVPTSNTQAREYGLDLNGDKTVDNQLGMVLSTLGTMGLDVQTAIDTAVAEGSIVLLVDFQTKDFTATTAAGIQVYIGDSDQVTPTACNGASDMYNPDTKTGCKKHLDGNGSFVVDSASPTNAALGGKIVAGTFNGGPGDLTLQIALGGTMAIQLDLIGARVKASSITDSMIGSGTSGGVIVGGAITKSDIDTKVIPAIQAQLNPIVMRDCTDLGNPTGGCGCATDSTGKTLLGLFDSSPKDCSISVEEIQTNQLVTSLLSPDVTIDGKMALSLGIKATATKATYTAPNQ